LCIRLTNCMSSGDDLVLPGAVPVHGCTLAAIFKGEAVGLINIVRSCACQQVHCLGYRIVRVFLERRLDSDVRFRVL